MIRPGPRSISTTQLRKLHRRLEYLEDLRRGFANLPRRRLLKPVEEYTQKPARRYGHPSKRTYTLEAEDDSEKEKICLSNLVDFRVSFADDTMGFDVLQNFLVFLWKTGTMGDGLKALMFEASGFDMALLVLPTIRAAAGFVGRSAGDPKVNPELANKSPLRNITNLTIRLSHSSKTSASTSTRLQKTLSQLLERLPSLSLFSIHSMLRDDYPEPWTLTHSGTPQIDLSTILRDLPFIQGLKSIKYNAPFTNNSLSDPSVLADWLKSYEDQLEELHVSPVGVAFLSEVITDNEAEREEVEESGSSSDGSRSSGVGPHNPPLSPSVGWRRRRNGPYTPMPGSQYTKWLYNLESGILRLRFPHLKRLEIQPCSVKDSDGPLVIPSLREVAPGLTSLKVANQWLTMSELRSIDGFGMVGDGKGSGFGIEVGPYIWNWSIDTLDISLRYLTPSVLDLLYVSLPKLRRLSLRYLSIGLKDDGPGLNRVSLVARSSGLPPLISYVIKLTPLGFFTALHDKRFPMWRITFIRIEGITTPKCLGTHPVLEVMRALASCLDTVPVLDTKKSETCRCKS